MKNLILSLTLLTLIAGCSVSDPDPKGKYTAADAEQDKRFAEQLDNAKVGGQPGKIKISGAVVLDGTKTDPRVRIVAEAGFGKNGKRTSVNADRAPQLTQAKPHLNLEKLSEDKTLIAVGCDPLKASALANERSLITASLPVPKNEYNLIASANTIVLCGKITQLKQVQVTINADVLIMDQAHYDQAGVVGIITFNANKLHLQGTNRIATQGAVPLLPGSIELNVLKELTSSEDGNLLLQSTGAYYFE